jgi:RimJ/RimL family protein N-acetyltransferase
MAFMGLPSILISLNNNQIPNVGELCEAGAALSPGSFDAFSEDTLLTMLEELIAAPERAREMSLRGRALVDGEGTTRVTTLMKTADTGEITFENLHIRSAQKTDAHALYQLAMDRDTRQNSFSPNPIPFAEHIRWFEEKLAETRQTGMWVYDYAGVVAGQVRYDRCDTDSAEIDISIHPVFRGKGIGAKLLKESAPLACRHLNVSRVKGVVIESNIPSRKCFLSAGFKEGGKQVRKEHVCITYDRKDP